VQTEQRPSGALGALRHVIALSAPVITTDLGLVVMGVVDTIVVGHIGPEAIGAVGLGNILFITVAMFGMGLLLGLDTVVSRAFGAGRLDECYRWLGHGVILVFIAMVPLTLLVFLLARLLPFWGLEPEVLALVVPYVEVSAWAVPALMLFSGLRRFLLAIGVVRAIAVVVILGNVLNLALANALVLGFGPIPALGTVGSAWATLISRIYLTACLALIVWLHARSAGIRRSVLHRIEAARLKMLVGLGGPAGIQATLEVGVFATATAFVAMLDVASLSAHQIVLQIATLTFVVALGMGSAGGVLVGQSIGAGEPQRARSVGSVSIASGVFCMAMGALVFLTLPRPIVGVFSDDAAVIDVGSRLLAVAAAFQLFDALQASSTGVLRGLGDTRTPMLGNIVGHWLLGLPLGYLLCFRAGLGVVGMWIGLSTGLVAIGLLLLGTWIYRSRALA
jgi:MATE family multidrug resistance protein